MEVLKKVFQNQIPKGDFYIKLYNSEDESLTVQLYDFNYFVFVTFKRYKAIRMIEEGMLLMNYIYSAPEFEKYKQDDFVNTIYEIIGGTYVKYLDEINNNNLRTNEMHAYIFVTMNYVTEIVTDTIPHFEVINR
ncbi:MAG: hypothetical protein HFF02_09925 [Erysipelotrichaceae bacterium]|nr:hypothetical protein [Erysipelotrichaceae bacterium]